MVQAFLQMLPPRGQRFRIFGKLEMNLAVRRRPDELEPLSIERLSDLAPKPQLPAFEEPKHLRCLSAPIKSTAVSAM
jgi:hypothetical protein